jgi:hypothetical protein
VCSSDLLRVLNTRKGDGEKKTRFKDGIKEIATNWKAKRKNNLTELEMMGAERGGNN